MYYRNNNTLIKKILCLVVFVSLYKILMPGNALASSVYTKGKTQLTLYGWLDYEGGFSNRTGPFFYKTNTSYESHTKNNILNNKQNKWNFQSRAQTRLGFIFVNSQTHTMGNIAMDSWPNNFHLMLAYVKQYLGNGYYMIAGKDWSLIKQHTFSSLCFKPFPSGFQGSKWYPQIQFGKSIDSESFSLTPKIAFEDRYNNSGVVVGKNVVSQNNIPISNSNVTITRKSVPAIAMSLSSRFNSNFGNPLKAYVFFEVQPIYLAYNGNEYEKNPYVWGFGINIHVLNKAIIASEYIHAIGFTGIAGIKGNNLKTYSYIYEKHNLVERRFDAFNIETYFFLTHKLGTSCGLDYVNFSNKNYLDSYFLKNEVKRVITIFALLRYRATKHTTVFMEWQNIKTKYATSNLTGNFNTSVGNELWFGYRYYF